MRLDSYHPTIALIYFVSALVFALNFDQPVFLLVGYVCAFAYSVKLNGLRALVFNLCLIPLGVAFALFYAYYNHFGVTNLSVNVIGNNITLEALVFGATRAVMLATAIMQFSCLLAVFTSDKVVYLLGRISPRLSLFLSILLRAIPRIKHEAKRIDTAQQGIGKGVGQGNIFRRLAHALREFSILLTWGLESFFESTQSMKSRGYTLKGRTAFSIYRFDNRDRSFVIAVFACMIVIGVGVVLNQTNTFYNPQIVVNRITPLSSVFYGAYAVLLLLPLGLQLFGEWRYARQRKTKGACE